MTQTLTTRWIAIAVLIVIAFFSAYKFAVASGADASPTTPAAGLVSGAPASPAGGSGTGATDPAAGGSGCACCGSSQPTAEGVTGDKVEAAAVVAGGVQRLDVDVSSGTYNPNVIKLKAGVPAEITFANGSGCTGQVMSEELGFFEDISAGPKTVKIPALTAGEYPFYCGMKMVFGKIVVE